MPRTKAKQIIAALLLAAFVCSSGCRKASAPAAPPGAVADSQERQHPESGAATVVETRFFSGSIGNALDLQMKLMRESDKLTGSYFYQKLGTRIDLRGTIDQNGNVTLDEFDSAGKQTGVFKGIWTQDSEGVIEIKGDWTKPTSDKKTAFELHQEPIEFSNGVEVASKQIREKNKKLKYEVDVAYPQLTGSTDPNYEKFNRATRALITKKVSDFKQEMTPSAEDAESSEPATNPALEESMGSDINVRYAVVLAKDDLVSIEFTVSSYSAGAAHPNSYTEVVNFDLKNGKQLKLADLFAPGSKYLQAIATYCIQDLKKQTKGADATLDDDWIQKGAAPELTNYDNWTVRKKGLGITFDPYQVGPYAAGPQNVVVPYASLKDIIRPDGPAAQFVK
jgi:hypothetical protein